MPARERSAVIVSVQTPSTSDREHQSSLRELEQLLRGLGIEVSARIEQKRPNHNAPTYVGEGKLRELAALTGGTGEIIRGPQEARPEGHGPLGLVVVDDELSPGQQRVLELATGAEVLDRTQVILEVFERRARTREAKLEIELARLEYELPRVRDDATLGDREGGGGRGGRGHSNVELAKQRSRERCAAIRNELEHLQESAVSRRERRLDTFRVALVGYTNAGKSSLMRLLTGSEVLVEDKLFATLGTTVRQLVPPASPPILVADTVGFINGLPHALVASFRSTLDEVHDASLLLYVVDASDPEFQQQLEVTRRVVGELGAESPSRIVFNKIDRVDDATRLALAREWPNALQICAHRPEDGQVLREALVSFFDRALVTAEVRIPYERLGRFAELRDQLRVLSEEYGDVLTASIRTTPDVLARLGRRIEE